MTMNKEELKEYHKKYHRTWQQNNPKKLRKIQKKYYENNRDVCLHRSKKWILNNPERVKELARNWRRIKWKTDSKFNLTLKVFRGINLSTKKNIKGRSWEKLVGYTCDDLVKKLKSTIPNEYTWQDYLDSKLHIDHIIPIAAFNYKKPEHLNFIKCWDLDNLRLLPAKENKIKKNVLIKPFQPVLEL